MLSGQVEDTNLRDGGTAAQRPRVYLHIGGPKTGTTYLQTILWQKRAALRADGVLYPGAHFGAHLDAAFDLRDAGFRGVKEPWVAGSWSRLVEEARTWDGTVVFSQELFSPATNEHVDRALADLSFAEVHVVYTARDLTRQIPAAWQEDLKNRGASTFDEFVEGQLGPVENKVKPAERFWRIRDAPDILSRWSRVLPPERVHVITVPRPGAPQTWLWERFAGLIGLDPELYDTSVAQGNLSLGTAETQFLRTLNVQLDDRIGWATYNRFVKLYLAQEVLSGRQGKERIELGAGQHERAAAQSEELATEFADRSYDIVGNLGDLVPAPETPRQSPVGPPSPSVQSEMALDALVGLLERIDSMRRKEEQLRERTERLEQEIARRRRQPVKTLIRDASERHRMVMRVRVAWWHAVEWTAGIASKIRSSRPAVSNDG